MLVSFIVTAFKSQFLKEALDSILSQTNIDDFEVLIMDDSPDSAVKLIVDEYPNDQFRYIRSPFQLGGIVGLDRGVELCRGKYVKFLNDDDYLAPLCTIKLISAMESNPNVTIATSKRTLIDQNGRVLPDVLFSVDPFGQDVRVKGDDLVEFIRYYPLNFIGEPSTVLARSSDLKGAFPQLSSLNNRLIISVNDLAMICRLLLKGDLAYISTPLSSFRIHGGQSQRQLSAEILGSYGRSVLVEQLDAVRLGPIKQDGRVRVKPLWSKDHKWVSHSIKAVFQKISALTDSDIDAFTKVSERIERSKTQQEDHALSNWFGKRTIDFGLRSLLKDQIKTSICLILIDREPQRFLPNITVSAFRTARHVNPWLSCAILSPNCDFYNKTYFQDISFFSLSDNLAASVNEAISTLEADWFVLADSCMEPSAPGLMVLGAELSNIPDGLKGVYGDELIRGEGGFKGAFFRPALNLDGLLSHPTVMSRHWVFRRNSVIESGGFDESFPDCFELDYILKTLEKDGLGAFGHVDEPLLIGDLESSRDNVTQQRDVILNHLARRGYASADVVSGLEQGTLRVQYNHGTAPRVTIIVPTKDQLHYLQTCIESLLEKTDYPNYEIFIVDNNSETPEAIAWLKGLEDMALPNLRILRYREEFNFSAMNNLAVREASGEYVLLLNNDTGIIRSDWLKALMNHAQRPEVGIVGAKLLFPRGGVQHAGVVLGLRGPAEHVFVKADSQAAGYMNRLKIDQNYMAVTAACMLVRKSVYEEVGGLDEDAFRVSFNDIDFCLKVSEAGYLTTWTPYSLVMHVGNVSQNEVDKSAHEAKVQRFRRETEEMYRRWLHYLGSDPAYNRNFALNRSSFELEQRVELNWQPQKLVNLPTVLIHPADLWGCGHYRMIQPFESMKSNAIAGGMIAHTRLTVPEMMRLSPDALVYQRQITPEAVENMKYARRFLKKPVVYELDDYLPNLPMKSAYRKNMPKDILKSLRASLKHVDRFVVSTHPLAEAFKGVHPDIRVVENRLPVDWWADLSAARRQSEKPRVGWAGGVGHTGDLELVEAVVRDLADEVDWVFFGMCPEGLRPCVKEVHEGVNIELYPEKLASMNLDLAIAPLEDNLFNRCKSNLRLLEYGACGFPVVCSDVEPYRAHELPVTRVKNRYKDWVDAIRMHLSDLDETARIGDELREVVCRDWMLEGENLQEWLGAWTKF